MNDIKGDITINHKYKSKLYVCIKNKKLQNAKKKVKINEKKINELNRSCKYLKGAD